MIPPNKEDEANIYASFDIHTGCMSDSLSVSCVRRLPFVARRKGPLLGLTFFNFFNVLVGSESMRDIVCMRIFSVV